jgi:hypothetical protein
MVLEPLKRWQSESIKAVRDSFDAFKWICEQRFKGIELVCQETLNVLSNTVALEYAGFARWREPLPRNSDLRASAIEREETLAELFGVLALRIVAEFIKRFMWILFGWPVGFLDIFRADGAKTCIADFRYDLARFHNLQREAVGFVGSPLRCA